MAKNETPKTVGGHKVEDLFAALREGRRLPGGICRDYDRAFPFYVCKEEPETAVSVYEHELVVAEQDTNPGE